MEMYSSGRRGAPAKGIGRATGARVRISPSPPYLRSSGVVVNMPPCHGGDRGFESHLDRHLCRCSSMVEHDLAMVDTGVRFPSSAPVVNMPPCHGGDRGFESHLDRHLCRCSSMVEHDLAMVDTGVRFPSSAPSFIFLVQWCSG